MTQLHADVCRRRRFTNESALGASSEGEDDSGATLGSGNPFDAGPATPGEARLQVFEDVDFDDLAEDLQCLGPLEAEQQARDALLRAGHEQIAAADVLAILLKAFMLIRDAALRDCDGWEVSIAYCDHLTSFCDKNFMQAANAEGGESEKHDLPASVVATVYAESGRTLALADKLPKARDRLEKALNVFAILPGAESSGTGTAEDDGLRRHWAAAVASLGRVYRRLGLTEEAEGRYIRALQLYTTLPVETDIADFLSEFCELISEKDADTLSPALPALLVELTEAKFGKSSDMYLHLLADIISACQTVGRADLACPALTARADALRNRCCFSSNAWAAAEAEAAEEEAATALEACLPCHLESGDLAGAASAWRQALRFRERVEGSNSQRVLAMRESLVALETALLSNSGSDLTIACDSSKDAHDSNTVEEEYDEPAVRAYEHVDVPEAWDDESYENAPLEVQQPALTSKTWTTMGLRPGGSCSSGGTHDRAKNISAKNPAEAFAKQVPGPSDGDAWDT